MLQANDKAYDFNLLDKDGNSHKLSDFKGKKVVLYFYPKDNTPGCTTQACAYRDNYQTFKDRDIIVIGISKDSIKSHTNFITKYNLPFLLLSDPNLEAIEAYGVWQEKKMCGKTYMGVVRTTFIINEEGIITHVLDKVKPATDYQTVLDLIA